MAINKKFVDELERQENNKPLKQQFQELEKAGINTPEGQDIIESIYKHPAYMGFIERLEKIKGRTIAKQQRYLDDGRMYPAILVFVRQKVEETDFGRVIVAKSPDRRIYALLKPTPAEDLHRIKVVFDCVREIVSPQKYEQFWLSLNSCHCAIRAAEKYDAGLISYEAAKDLLDEIFPPEQGEIIDGNS